MRAVTADEMKRIDHYAIEVLEIPGILLMENAALKVISNIDLNVRRTFAVVCGTGNNGGDGLAIARGLLALDKYVDVYIVGDMNRATKDFMTNYRILQKMRATIIHVDTLGSLETMERNLNKVNMIVDAIFGTGLTRAVVGVQEYAIDMINRSRIYTLSVDMPSGFDATTGEIHSVAIDPSMVVVFQLMKKGLLNNRYIDARIVVEPIGIPSMAIEAVLGKRIF